MQQYRDNKDLIKAVMFGNASEEDKLQAEIALLKQQLAVANKNLNNPGYLINLLKKQVTFYKNAEELMGLVLAVCKSAGLNYSHLDSTSHLQYCASNLSGAIEDTLYEITESERVEED